MKESPMTAASEVRPWNPSWELNGEGEYEATSQVGDDGLLFRWTIGLSADLPGAFVIGGEIYPSELRDKPYDSFHAALEVVKRMEADAVAACKQDEPDPQPVETATEGAVKLEPGEWIFWDADDQVERTGSLRRTYGEYPWHASVVVGTTLYAPAFLEDGRPTSPAGRFWIRRKHAPEKADLITGPVVIDSEGEYIAEGDDSEQSYDGQVFRLSEIYGKPGYWTGVAPDGWVGYFDSSGVNANGVGIRIVRKAPSPVEAPEPGLSEPLAVKQLECTVVMSAGIRPPASQALSEPLREDWWWLIKGNGDRLKAYVRQNATKTGWLVEWQDCCVSGVLTCQDDGRIGMFQGALLRPVQPPRVEPWTSDEDKGRMFGKTVRRKSSQREMRIGGIDGVGAFLNAGMFPTWGVLAQEFEQLDGSPCGRLIRDPFDEDSGE